MTEKLERMKHGKGFIAALDQSGGSTPKALASYGVFDDAYENEEAMYDCVHAMRTRIMKSPVFTSEKILGVILFENTMDRSIDAMNTADYLWDVKGILSFLKVDKGLETEQHGVQLMKPIPDLSTLLERARIHNIFGTKMRSVIKLANRQGIESIVAQQFMFAKQISSAGLIPIIEPEVDIHSEEKIQAEKILREVLIQYLDAWDGPTPVMLKLTIPTVVNHYEALTRHPNVLRVVALSGGYDRNEANRLLKSNKDIIASFSRALVQGLSVHQSASEFDEVLGASINAIYDASID